MQMIKDAEPIAGVYTHTDNLTNKESINIISAQNKPIN